MLRLPESNELSLVGKIALILFELMHFWNYFDISLVML